MRRSRRKVQVVLEVMPGAEPWVLVKHSRGHFKVPGSVEALVLVEGALAAWGSTPTTTREGQLYVRVPLSELTRLQAADSAMRAIQASGAL